MTRKFIVLAILIFSMNLVAFAQKKMSVKDYFLAIPAEFMKSEPEKRTSWIKSESVSDGFLSYEIPIKEITGEDGDGKVWGDFLVFPKKAGGVMVGLSTNLCEQKICIGQLLFLDYKAGKFTDVTEDFAPTIDNDEVIKILRAAPAFDKPLKDGVEVPLYINFGANDKVVQFASGGENGDGGVVAKTFKWNGENFVEFEYPESPE